MRKNFLLILILPFGLSGQPNCNVYEGDCKKACEFGIQAEGGQGSRSSQKKFDRAISLCPDKIAYFYMEKAVPYLKRGDFITWKKLIDKAVEIDPLGQLGYRGWCRMSFLRDYEGAIDDIELLDSISVGDIGYSQNGQYHLNTSLALCYKKIGDLEKAIDILETHISSDDYTPWAFEYLHLGVMKYEAGDFEEAKMYFEKQLSLSVELAETHYYMALVMKQLDDDLWLSHIQKAEVLYRAEKKLFDVYCTPLDKIYLADIKKELEFNR